MKIYDTKQKKVLPFKTNKTVRMYVCGITPYESAHVGHIFTFMTYDLLQRRLEDLGHEVCLVRNITDVDEPIYVRAKELGVPYTELADREVKSFNDTLTRLHFKPVFAEPRASQYIPEMIDAISTLKTNGFTYILEGDIYFDVSKDPSFGSFAGFNEKLQLAFMANRGGDPERQGKRNPLDFLLWKDVKDTKDPARWDSPFGFGRPGWHIECSVMANKLLGTPFDLHGGGTDLIFPHHECEIAQDYGLGITEPVKYWMHVSPMLLYGEKMSKSLGNLVFAKELLKKYDFATIRLALMHYHHLNGGEWQKEYLEESQSLLNQLHAQKQKINLAQAERFISEVRAALDDDLNSPAIIVAMERLVSQPAVKLSPQAVSTVDRALSLLGLAAS